MKFASKKYRGLDSWVHGKAYGDDNEISETWTAICRLNPYVHGLGLILTIIGFSIMILGLFLEVGVVLWLRRLKAKCSEYVNSKDLPTERLEKTGGLLWYIENNKNIESENS